MYQLIHSTNEMIRIIELDHELNCCDLTLTESYHMQLYMNLFVVNKSAELKECSVAWNPVYVNEY